MALLPLHLVGVAAVECRSRSHEVVSRDQGFVNNERNSGLVPLKQKTSFSETFHSDFEVECGFAYTTTTQQINQFALAGASVVVTASDTYQTFTAIRDGRGQKYSKGEYGERLYELMPSGHTDVSQGTEGKIMVASGDRYKSGNYASLDANHYIVKLLDTATIIKLSSAQFKVQLPKSVPKIPNFLGILPRKRL